MARYHRFFHAAEPGLTLPFPAAILMIRNGTPRFPQVLWQQRRHGPTETAGEAEIHMHDVDGRFAQFARYPSLKERCVLVTGGATGIGAALVTNFVRQGSRVAFFDIEDEAGKWLVAALAAEDLAAPIYVHCDLTDVTALQNAVEQVIAALGTVDVLVNNAGNDQRVQVEDVTPEFWDRSMAINLRPQFFMVQAVLPAMRAAGRGSIINMSSISWMIPSTGVPVYVAAKAAVVGLARTIAHELGAHNIRVNAVLPGAVATERQKQLWYTPEYVAEIQRNQALKRQIEPNEVARLVLFLAADDSSAITNQSYVIDAGWVC
jgi:D-xylose 1-dehydrogenase